MKNSNAWTFGLIFIVIFIILAFNKFELPKIFIGETKKIKGTIIDVQLVRGIRGIGYNQNIKILYSVNDNWFENDFIVDSKFKPQRIGKNVILKISSSRPEKFKVIGFEKKYFPFEGETYIRSYKPGYYELKLENNILTKTRFGLKGKVLKKELGKFDILNDTLTFYPIKIIDSVGNTKFIPKSKLKLYKQLFLYKQNESLVNANDTLIVFTNS